MLLRAPALSLLRWAVDQYAIDFVWASSLIIRENSTMRKKSSSWGQQNVSWKYGIWARNGSLFSFLLCKSTSQLDFLSMVVVDVQKADYPSILSQNCQTNHFHFSTHLTRKKGPCICREPPSEPPDNNIYPQTSLFSLALFGEGKDH